MVSLIQRIEQNAKLTPNRIILSDEHGEYTNLQLWELSGRVYAYLLQQHIGKEDVVLIHLPRGAQAVMAMVGVFRAGAAVVMMEDWGENEWVSFVKQEVQPRLIINSAIMATILQIPPTDGYRLPNLHDLAYIAYTTGTTGQNKGVMHEYGTLEKLLDTYDVVFRKFHMYEDRTAHTTTLHTAVPVISTYVALNTYIDIVPLKTIESPQLFHQRLCDKRITYTYLSPIYINQHGTDVVDTPYMRYISVCFEPINAVYSDRVPIYNDYGMRETGMVIAEFYIDKPYDVTPIGKPLPGYHLSILDAHDQPIPDGELGEICVDNTYCRGYLHLPQVTKEHFRNGLYHTHDLGKRLPDGNYIMYGRLNDALRTKNGLIIALEIEVEARKILGKSSAYVKLFPTDKHPIICLYTDFPVDFPSLQAQLRQVLPEYKVPTDHVQVDHFEYKNGKAIRVHLTNPRA